MTHFKTEIIEFDGCRVRIEYHFDTDADPPWENCDGHGPVRMSTVGRHCGRSTDKRPGERPMNWPGPHGNRYYYDWQAACTLAKFHSWNAAPFDAPNRVERAVQADFEFLSAWLNDDWHYVGIVCTVVDKDDDPVKVAGGRYEDSLWGVESWKDYHETHGREMADELAQRYLEDVAQPEEETRA